MKIYYLGWYNYQNFGDDVNKEIIEELGFEHDEDSDILLVGGGTLLPISDKLIERVKDKDFKEVIFFGTGGADELEKITKDLSITNELLDKAKFIGLRDEATKEMINKGKVIGDPFFALGQDNIKCTYVKKKYCVLNIGCSDLSTYGGMEAKLDSIKETLKFVKKVIIDKMNMNVVIVPLWSNDIPFACLAANYLKQHYLTDFLNKEKVLDIYKNASFSINFKLHGMISSLLVNKPSVNIVYRPKQLNIMEDFKLEKHCLRIDEVNEDNLFKCLVNIKEWNCNFIDTKKRDYYNKIHCFVEEIKKEYGE